MADFKPFAGAVANQFALMSKQELYTVNIDGDTLYAAYLAAFPEGTNPIFREKTEHDCSCCRNFIKNIGNVICISEGKVSTVWDNFTGLPAPYDLVSMQLALLVSKATITGLFRTQEKKYGAESSKEYIDPAGPDAFVRTWNHFHGTIAAKHFSLQADKEKGDFNTTVGVFERGLKDLTPDALSTVLTLIAEKQLYRGDEHKKAVTEFSKFNQQFRNLNSVNAQKEFAVVNASSVYARFRNTAIGTLVTDLSEGVPLDIAVKSFETKVAPENYKRPTSLVTEKMKQDALATITSLGLEDSLVRRFANIHDITINNVMWADNAVKPMMKEGLAGIMDTIATSSVARMKGGLVTDISIEDFLATVLPKAKTIDMLVKNRHMNNFMAITAGVNPSNGDLFKWDNNFAWTYTGNISDSIKQRVKAAGGSTDAVLRVSLAWHNGDDLDLHASEPNGTRVYFGNRNAKSKGNGGQLDVDMNAGMSNNSKDPVENITWTTPGDGDYEIKVHNFSLRNKSDVGYTLEVENNGVTHQYTSEQSPSQSLYHGALVLTVKDRVVTNIKPMKTLVGGSFSQAKWGINTEQAVRVNTIMLSPNYWDGNATGNKHYMFILEGCKADEPLRGIMNEYLHGALEPHRKVFELLGEKTKCQPTQDQLSGLGFSSTKGDSIEVNVTGDKLNKSYNIIF